MLWFIVHNGLYAASVYSAEYVLHGEYWITFYGLLCLGNMLIVNNNVQEAQYVPSYENKAYTFYIVYQGTQRKSYKRSEMNSYRCTEVRNSTCVCS